MTEEFRLDVAEGKYTFILYRDDWRVYCLRYGEAWMVFKEGHKAISALMRELLEVRGSNEM